MAIDKGKIVAIGTNSDISKQYESKIQSMGMASLFIQD
jgi:putative cell wall-binding protein